MEINNSNTKVSTKHTCISVYLVYLVLILVIQMQLDQEGKRSDVQKLNDISSIKHFMTKYFSQQKYTT